MFSRFFSILITNLVIFFPLFQVAQTVQTFSYSTPICKNGGNKSPLTSLNWQGGGVYSSQPGLNLNTTTGVINALNSSPGSYTVSYSGSLCGCTPTTVVQVVNPSFLAVSGNSACAGPGATASLTAIPLTLSSYTWSFNGQHNGTTTIPSGIPGPYTLSGTDQNGCKSFTVFNVTFFVAFNPVINGSPLVCLGSTITLIASGATSFTWNTGATTSVLPVSPSVSTGYTVSSKDVRGCIGKKTHSVTVLPVPVFSVNNYTLCSGLTTILSANNVSPSNVSFSWTPGALKGGSVSVSPTQSTNYTVTGSNGCATLKVVKVTVLPSFKPSTNFSYSLALCAGQAASAFPDTTDNFTWGGKFYTTIGEGYSTGLPLDSSTGKIDVKNAKAGTYLITYSIPTTSLAAVGCTIAASNTAIVSMIDSTQLTISSDVTITEGESTKLTVGGADSVIWNPPLGLSCYKCAETMAYPSETTTYCVRGISNSCYSSACVKVDVVCHNNNDFSVPNAFTPNADGLNDELCLKGWEGCNRGFKIKIFNRWGEQLYESDDPNFCWDGIFNGALLDADVYAYYIKARFFGEAEFVKSGNITLLR